MLSNSKKHEGVLWTVDFILVCLTVLFTGISMRILDANLAPFASTVWESRTLGGYLTSVFNIGSIITAFFAGKLVDIRGRRNCLIFGFLLCGVPYFAMALWQTPTVGLAVRFIQGVGKGITAVAAASIVSDVIPRSRMNEGMGMYNLPGTLTFAFGPMLGLVLADTSGYGVVFLVCAACYVISAGMSINIRYEKKASARRFEEEEVSTSSQKEYRGLWKLIEKKAVLYSINFTVFFASYACVLVFITVYAQELLHLNSTQIGIFYMVAAATMFLFRITCSKLADIYGVLCLIIPGHLCIMVMLIILAYFSSDNYMLFLVAGGLYGVGNAAVMPAINAAVVVDSPHGRAGVANATFYFMMDFGILFASAIFGVLIDAAVNPMDGYRMMFVISFVICVASLVMAVLLLNEKARARRRASN